MCAVEYNRSRTVWCGMLNQASRTTVAGEILSLPIIWCGKEPLGVLGPTMYYISYCVGKKCSMGKSNGKSNSKEENRKGPRFPDSCLL